MSTKAYELRSRWTDKVITNRKSIALLPQYYVTWASNPKDANIMLYTINAYSAAVSTSRYCVKKKKKSIVGNVTASAIKRIHAVVLQLIRYYYYYHLHRLDKNH